MEEQPQQSDAFFEHFRRQDGPTKAGAGLVRALARKIFEYAQIPRNSSVLEIGPGRGDFADICLEKGIEYSAVEANRQMAESLQNRGAHVIRAMVPPLPSMDKQFDTAVMINVMEHMNDMKDALAMTRQITEVLKPGGKLVICSPDYLNWRHHFFNCDFSHSYVTTRRRLEQLLINGGFDQVRSCHLCGPMSGLLCFIVSVLVCRLPFGFLNAAFPNCKLFYKLYKAQLTFLRKVLIVGQKPVQSENAGETPDHLEPK